MVKESEPAASEPAGDEPEVKDHSEVAAPSGAASIPELVGSQAYEEAKEAQTKRPKKPRKPKSFLTRRHQLWPTHFWPKSWRRAWRQKALERIARQNETSDSEAEAS